MFSEFVQGNIYQLTVRTAEHAGASRQVVQELGEAVTVILTRGTSAKWCEKEDYVVVRHDITTVLLIMFISTALTLDFLLQCQHILMT